MDETDGGARVYEGSRLCLELAATTRSGLVHVLPEELLALCFVELKQRVAASLAKQSDSTPRAGVLSTLIASFLLFVSSPLTFFSPHSLTSTLTS